ncbi:TTL-domain-containing protein [Delitschia confertaspora ATCC 74209]|uniref:TTL-domain-containing protein n=1 Tax=Delitschia confertaspora ATCC 74209 TaxID=1513339 RepID=A0A9P4JNK9_9PLEO|nr:TTL-domain-containing protein [Delitschia confertaspora ATCC 74209]
MIVRESPKKSAAQQPPNWPPRSPHEAILSSPGARKKYEERRARQRTSTSPSPLKRTSRLTSRLQPEDESDEEDAETLELKLKAIETRLKLKKLQQAKARQAVEDEGNGSGRTPSRTGTATSGRHPELPRPASAVEIPMSPVRNRRPPEEPKSPARVLLGIDKGMRAQDVSLKRPAGPNARSGGGTVPTFLARANATKSAETAPKKTFSERLAEARTKEKAKEEKQERIEKSRSRGFGLNTNGTGLPSRAGTSMSGTFGTPRSSRDMAPPTRKGPELLKSPSFGDLRPPSTLSSRSDPQSTVFSRPSSSSTQATTITPTSSFERPSLERSNSDQTSLFESFSGLHLKTRHIPHTNLTRTLDTKTIYTIPQLLKTVKSPNYDPPDVESDFVVIGIIASSSAPLNTKNAQRTAKSESDTSSAGKFMVIRLTDLRWELDLYLFDTGFSRFYKLTTGTLVAILNPDIMPPRNRDTGKFSLKLTSSDDTVLEIGVARDLDFCHAMKKDGKECGQWVDKRKTEYCDFHINLQVEKARRGRMEVNTIASFGQGARNGGMFSGGGNRSAKFKNDGLLRSHGRYHDRDLGETMYIAPGPGAAAKLLDGEDLFRREGVGRAEQHRKRLAEQEKERELAKKLGEMGRGAGSDYMKAQAARKPGPFTQGNSSQAQGAANPADDQAAGGLSEAVMELLGKKAGHVSLSPVKRKRTLGTTVTKSTPKEPVGWSGAFKRGLLLSPKKEEKKDEKRESSPAKKRARFMLEEKGIREPGRDSLGGLDRSPILAIEIYSKIKLGPEDLSLASYSRIIFGASQTSVSVPHVHSETSRAQPHTKGQTQYTTMSSNQKEASTPTTTAPKFHAIIAYEDPYVQPLILSALSRTLPQSTYTLITAPSSLPTASTPLLQFLPYESLDFPHLLDHPTTSLANAYIIRKALIRKHYLSTTVANWTTKHPASLLKRHVKPAIEFEVDYAEFLDDALVEAYELRESWEKGQGKDASEREWWILKPGMSDRGQGIRLFSSEDELTAIFEEWEGDSDEEVDEQEQDARSDGGAVGDEKDGIITSQLRHFVAQPYIHPPLLLESGKDAKKFHIRTYVLAVGALKVYVYKPMLALFAARPYVPPWETSNNEEGLRAHLTNTCLQETGEREGSVALFWDLKDEIPEEQSGWKDLVYQQIKDITADVFEAAARGMMVHFQPLPNAFELYGVDFMVGKDENGNLTTYLLEVNAFPDFKQTGEDLKELVAGLFEEVADVAVKPFFGLGDEGSRGTQRMERVLDIDLGRR